MLFICLPLHLRRGKLRIKGLIAQLLLFPELQDGGVGRGRIFPYGKTAFIYVLR